MPYVSNLGADHYFGAVFEVEDAPKRYVMAIVPCAAAGVELSDNTKFVALDGTRTFSVSMRDVMISDAFVLADPSDAFIARIRAGFVLLQAGMGIGLIRGCIALMNQVKGPLGHVNKYLDVQPEHLAERLGTLEATVDRLAATPFDRDQAYWRAVIEARIAIGEAAVAAAHAAMLHCGARGYVANAAAQRRLREILLRCHRHARHQAAQENARRHGALDRRTAAAGLAARRHHRRDNVRHSSPGATHE